MSVLGCLSLVLKSGEFLKDKNEMVQDTHAILGKFYVPFSDLLNVVNSSMFGNCFCVRKMITPLRKNQIWGN